MPPSVYLCMYGMDIYIITACVDTRSIKILHSESYIAREQTQS